MFVSRSKGRYTATRAPGLKAGRRVTRRGGEIRPQGVIGRREPASPGAQVLAQLTFHEWIMGMTRGDGATRLCRFGPLLPT